MPVFLTRVVIFICTFLGVIPVAGQERTQISAASLAQLNSQARIDFAGFPGELKIGWFEANDDASEFIVFDQAGQLYRVSEAGIKDSWSYVAPGRSQVFSLIDATYLGGEPLVLYVLDGRYFINKRALPAGYEPVALASLGASLFVEAIGADGRTVFMHYALRDEGEARQLVDEFSVPESDPEQPVVRIGRIDFPYVLYSALSDGVLSVFSYPDSFVASMRRSYSLRQGPAVFGAVNAAGTHFAWSDPASARLNLLEFETGDNRVVAETGGAYAQYYLLSADASAILAVNLDFSPEVFAWDVETGERLDLGGYRECERIPDKVALSADGTALVIGCDTGLEIWRVTGSEESGES